jgi:hypothetical protein
MADFRTVRLRFDQETGAAEIEDRVHIPGMRMVLESVAADGERVYVVRFPGHSYRSLAGSEHAPASFEVFMEDYPESHIGREERADDAPWIKVKTIVRFPVLVGTKREF